MDGPVLEIENGMIYKGAFLIGWLKRDFSVPCDVLIDSPTQYRGRAVSLDTFGESFGHAKSGERIAILVRDSGITDVTSIIGSTVYELKDMAGDSHAENQQQP